MAPTQNGQHQHRPRPGPAAGALPTAANAANTAKHGEKNVAAEEPEPEEQGRFHVEKEKNSTRKGRGRQCLSCPSYLSCPVNYALICLIFLVDFDLLVSLQGVHSRRAEREAQRLKVVQERRGVDSVDRVRPGCPRRRSFSLVFVDAERSRRSRFETSRPP